MISNICFKKRLTQSVNKTDYLKLSWVVQNLSLLYTERERDIRSQMCRWVDKRYSELDFGQISKQTFTECLSGVGTLSTKLRVNLLLWLFWLGLRIWPATRNSSNIKKEAQWEDTKLLQIFFVKFYSGILSRDLRLIHVIYHLYIFMNKKIAFLDRHLSKLELRTLK